MRQHERAIMRFILRTTRDREDALDLFQETWLRAYRAYPKLNGADGLRPWLYRIASNLCLNRLRDHLRRARVFVDNDGADPSSYHAANSSPDGVLQLKHAIGRLPHKQREALVLRKIAGLEYDEIGASLGCSEEAARANVYQAIKKMKAADCR